MWRPTESCLAQLGAVRNSCREGLIALMPVVRHDNGKMMRQMDRTIKLHSIVESHSTGDECPDNEEEECDT